MIEADKLIRDVNSFKTSELLHPEVMDLKTISEILKQRGVEEPTSRGQVQFQTMEKALEIYHMFVLPKPQRVYKSDTRVGQKLLKNRQKSSAPSTSSSPEKKSDLNNKSVTLAPAAIKRPFPSEFQRHNNNNLAEKKGRHANINWP